MTHPIKDFDHRFQEGRTKVEEMFVLGREAQRLTIARKKEKQKARKNKQPLKKKPNPCNALADQYQVGVATVNCARRAAEGFTKTQLSRVLDLLYEAHQVPRLELFRIWATVPDQHRDEWVRMTIDARWTVEELSSRVLQKFSRRSNGGKKPDKPTCAMEASRNLQKTRARLLATHEAIISLPPLEDGPNPAQLIENWKRLDESLQQMADAVEALNWEPEDNEGGDC